MEIKKVYPQGFCEGVVRAIQLVKKIREENPLSPIFVYGMIVHNSYVVKELDDLEIVTLKRNDDSFDSLIHSLPKNSILIFTAHGTDLKLIKKAKDAGLVVYDAICHNVLATRQEIEQKITEDYEIIYIGKNKHPEAMAMLSINPKLIHLVENIEDIASLKIANKKIFITTQTTLSNYDTNLIIEQLKFAYPSSIVSKGICNATTMRQKAILDSDETDTMIIVGDNASNNTKQLYLLAKTKNLKNIILTEDGNDLDYQALSRCQSISITSGASTPKYLVDRIISKLKK